MATWLRPGKNVLASLLILSAQTQVSLIKGGVTRNIQDINYWPHQDNYQETSPILGYDYSKQNHQSYCPLNSSPKPNENTLVQDSTPRYTIHEDTIGSCTVSPYGTGYQQYVSTKGNTVEYVQSHPPVNERSNEDNERYYASLSTNRQDFRADVPQNYGLDTLKIQSTNIGERSESTRNDGSQFCSHGNLINKLNENFENDKNAKITNSEDSDPQLCIHGNKIPKSTKIKSDPELENNQDTSKSEDITDALNYYKTDKSLEESDIIEETGIRSESYYLKDGEDFILSKDPASGIYNLRYDFVTSELPQKPTKFVSKRNDLSEPDFISQQPKITTTSKHHPDCAAGKEQDPQEATQKSSHYNKDSSSQINSIQPLKIKKQDQETLRKNVVDNTEYSRNSPIFLVEEKDRQCPVHRNTTRDDDILHSSKRNPRNYDHLARHHYNDGKTYAQYSQTNQKQHPQHIVPGPITKTQPNSFETPNNRMIQREISKSTPEYKANTELSSDKNYLINSETPGDFSILENSPEILFQLSKTGPSKLEQYLPPQDYEQSTNTFKENKIISNNSAESTLVFQTTDEILLNTTCFIPKNPFLNLHYIKEHKTNKNVTRPVSKQRKSPRIVNATIITDTTYSYGDWYKYYMFNNNNNTITKNNNGNYDSAYSNLTYYASSYIPSSYNVYNNTCDPAQVSLNGTLNSIYLPYYNYGEIYNPANYKDLYDVNYKEL